MTLNKTHHVIYEYDSCYLRIVNRTINQTGRYARCVFIIKCCNEHIILYILKVNHLKFLVTVIKDNHKN